MHMRGSVTVCERRACVYVTCHNMVSHAYEVECSHDVNLGSCKPQAGGRAARVSGLHSSACGPRQCTCVALSQFVSGARVYMHITSQYGLWTYVQKNTCVALSLFVSGARVYMCLNVPLSNWYPCISWGIADFNRVSYNLESKRQCLEHGYESNCCMHPLLIRGTALTVHSSRCAQVVPITRYMP